MTKRIIIVTSAVVAAVMLTFAPATADVMPHGLSTFNQVMPHG